MTQAEQICICLELVFLWKVMIAHQILEKLKKKINFHI